MERRTRVEYVEVVDLAGDEDIGIGALQAGRDGRVDVVGDLVHGEAAALADVLAHHTDTRVGRGVASRIGVICLQLRVGHILPVERHAAAGLVAAGSRPVVSAAIPIGRQRRACGIDGGRDVFVGTGVHCGCQTGNIALALRGNDRSVEEGVAAGGGRC